MRLRLAAAAAAHCRPAASPCCPAASPPSVCAGLERLPCAAVGADRLDETNAVCCGDDPAAACAHGSPPAACSPLCAVTFHALAADCGEALLNLAGEANAERFAAFDETVKSTGLWSTVSVCTGLWPTLCAQGSGRPTLCAQGSGLWSLGTGLWPTAAAAALCATLCCPKPRLSRALPRRRAAQCTSDQAVDPSYFLDAIATAECVDWTLHAAMVAGGGAGGRPSGWGQGSNGGGGGWAEGGIGPVAAGDRFLIIAGDGGFNEEQHIQINLGGGAMGYTDGHIDYVGGGGGASGE